MLLGAMALGLMSFDTNSFEAPADICSIYANQEAEAAEANGGNYWQAWFAAYGDCTEIVNR